MEFGTEERRSDERNTELREQCAKGQIFLSGQFVIQAVQNHYPDPGNYQSSRARILVWSDHYEGSISRIWLDFMPLRLEPNGNQMQEITPRPEIITFQDYDQKDYPALRLPQSMTLLSTWLFMLEKTPKGSYYLAYEVTSDRSHAFVSPVASTKHTIGLCPIAGRIGSL